MALQEEKKLKQLEYFKYQKEQHFKNTEDKIKELEKELVLYTKSKEDERDKEKINLNNKLEEFRQKIEMQKKKLDDSLTAFEKKIEMQEEDVDEDCKKSIKRKKEKIEVKEREIKLKQLSYSTYCINNIIERI